MRKVSQNLGQISILYSVTQTTEMEIQSKVANTTSKVSQTAIEEYRESNLLWGSALHNLNK